MSDYLQLGPVEFAGFELPARIGFGGAQRMAVHTLSGGARVIDALGRDDADICWSGAFSGPDAAERARLLDLLRAEGGAWLLAWDAFAYLVVIAEFEAQYEHPNWTPYRIRCRVAQDLTQAPLELAVSLGASLLADLGMVGAADTTAAAAALAATGAVSPGTAAYAAAGGALASLAAQVSRGLSDAGAALLTADDPAAAAAAAGQVADFADARGYVARAWANLGFAGE